MKLYPLKFDPIFKPVIWGGSDICKFKNISPPMDGIGESWEISCVKNNISVISNGELAGTSLEELLSKTKSQLVGEKIYEKYGDTFPLLIKFIDAHDNLSIQVHPNDDLARKRHNSFGKTEMWYAINANPGAFLYSGFAKKITPEEYIERIKNDTFIETLKKHEVKPGDVFFIPAGRVHAIGAGCFIAEIQQTSDITYRIYDYNRADAQGKPRELHTELAKDAIDYTVHDSYRTMYEPCINQPVKLVSCPYFTTNLLDIDRPIERKYHHFDSFVIYICIKGDSMVNDDKGNVIPFHRGESLLIPAVTKTVEVIPSAYTKILETYIE